MKNLTQLLITLVLCMFVNEVKVFAQSFVKKLDVPVLNNGNDLRNPWAGGINNGQFWEADLNNNGTKDLVVFDRKDNKLMTFINQGTANEIDYDYAPEFENNFPTINNWCVLKDFNCDEIPDLFVNDKLGISNGNVKIYKGYYEYNQLNFISFIDTLFYYDEFADSLPTKFFNISPFDIPAIEDINNDGDIDILTFNISGGYVEYFENQSVEQGENCDTIIYNLVDPCWGKFYESGVTPAIDLLDSCITGLWNDNLVERMQLHPGSTLLAVDFTGDDLKELFLGDISFENTIYLENSGSLNNALMTAQDTIFPSYDTPAFYKNFPASFYLDVDNDGIKDFISSPNATGIVENVKCAWFYKNEGLTNLPDLNLQQNNFLVDDMIDVGNAGKPVFFDYNDDGNMDLVIANDGYYNTADNILNSSLTLYKNIGTTTNPAFEFITDDYLDLYSNYQFVNIYPAFGDLNGDGLLDLLVGTENGETHYFENTSTAGMEATFSLETVDIFDPGQAATPFIFDLNGDGLNDVICGERNGNINYFENIGTAQSPDFEWLNPDAVYPIIWGVNVRAFGEVTGYSVPKIGYFFGSENLQLIVGSESGKIYIYDDIETNINGGVFNLKTDDLLENYNGIRAAATIFDLNNDNQQEIIVGTLRGGLSYYTFDSLMVSNQNEILNGDYDIALFPNPTNNFVHINLENQILKFVEIYNNAGKLISTTKNTSIDLSNYANGIYLFKIVGNDFVTVQKVLKN